MHGALTVFKYAEVVLTHGKSAIEKGETNGKNLSCSLKTVI